VGNDVGVWAFESRSVTIDDAAARAVALDVRHDLRHSASTILMLIGTLQGRDHDAATHAALDGIEHCARSITDMVSELDEQSSRELVDIAQLAIQTGGRTSLLYPGTLTVQAEPGLVIAHELDISRLLTNLMQNACRAAGADGIVRLTVENEDSWCVIRIGDSGTGFVEKPTYAGIGLALVAGIAVLLEGYITLGRSPLGGALVAVHLPRFQDGDPGGKSADVGREFGS
jgi:signal transduction histidine kinase